MQKRLFQKITFLGTSSGVPTPHRNVSSYCVSFTDGAVWMFDCGEGTQHRLQSCDSVSLGRLERLFITHVHGDHQLGSYGMMMSLAMTWGKKTPQKQQEQNSSATSATSAASSSSSSSCAKPAEADCEEGEEHFGGEEEEGGAERKLEFKPFLPHSEYFEIVGPENISHMFRTIFKCCETYFPFRYRVTELLKKGSKKPLLEASDLHWCEATPRFILPDEETGIYNDLLDNPSVSAGGVGVKAVQLKHTVFCIGYSLTEPETPGALDIAKATELGVPKGPLLSKLKAGQTITLPDNKTQISSSQVVGANVAGRQLLCLGDTCDSDECLKICTKPEAVVHESTFDDANAALALPRGHSTARMAGAFASRIEAKMLILTHFSARFLPPNKDPEPVNLLLKEAASGAEAEGEKLNRKNQPKIVAACDYSVFELMRKKN